MEITIRNIIAILIGLASSLFASATYAGGISDNASCGEKVWASEIHKTYLTTRYIRKNGDARRVDTTEIYLNTTHKFVKKIRLTFVDKAGHLNFSKCEKEKITIPYSVEQLPMLLHLLDIANSGGKQRLVCSVTISDIVPNLDQESRVGECHLENIRE